MSTAETSTSDNRAQRFLSRWSRQLRKIEQFEEGFRNCADVELRRTSLSLRYRAKSGEKLTSLLPEAYALVREAARRTIQMRHYDVQVLGGIALAHGQIAEMATGEGKTLTATMPMYLFALAGKGSHLATVNDYLAERDADWMRPIYEMLAMKVGVIRSESTPAQRRDAYNRDITYGTAKEFGFDFLRDRLMIRHVRERQSIGLVNSRASALRDLVVGRNAFFVLVDEADSILIDEATTPLIIGTVEPRTRQRVTACFRWAAENSGKLQDGKDYVLDHEKKTVELTETGRQLVRILPHERVMRTVGLVELYQYMEQAIKVRHEFHLDQHYVVRDGEIVIVDEYTGRLGEGRKWRDGVHQAIEAKEDVEITMPTGHAARVTVQDFFLRYENLAGMTGTAITSAGELRKVYKRPVIQIPTNRPVNRQQLGSRVFGKEQAKWSAIAEEVRSLHEAGRPVLIGTRTIDKSEYLSQLLNDAGIPHQVLNARHIAAEAEIVAEAGHPGRVTVATNMAGRGTDIKLGGGVAELGGLHVICTEIHDAARIDRQLLGRCGRQGDPGSYRQYVSLEDDILAQGFGPKKANKLVSSWTSRDGELTRSVGLFRRAQRRLERRRLRQRMMLLYQEKQRQKMQREMGQDPHLDSPD